MKVLFLLIIALVNSLTYSQDIKVGYINNGAISKNISCGIGEIFVVPEAIIPIKDSKLTENNLQNENLQEAFVLAYPNPAGDYLYVTSSSELGRVVLSTLDGKELGSYTVSKTTPIDLSVLAEGTYIILFPENDFEPIKFIKR